MSVVSICIDVADVKQATQFYTQVLECTIKQEKSDSTELQVENSTVYLIQKEENSNPLVKGTASRIYQRHWTPVHLDFHVDNIEQAITLVTEFGGEVEEQQSGDWGSAAFCADPFGNGFCLIKIN
ncbi:MAG: VOC family protein [Gammaproteobacteria bacterium]|nr:VOC family protein [Gammaproteobacteria bacterium]